MHFEKFLAPLFLLASSFAYADLAVDFDCYAPISNLNCPDIEQNYFSGIKFLTSVSDTKTADLSIKLRANKVEGGIQYIVQFAGTGELPSFQLLENIPNTMSQASALVRLVTVIHKGTVPYLSILEPVKEDEAGGSYTMVLADPSQKQAEPTQNDGSTNWYISPGISGSFSKSENESFSIGGRVEANYSSADWRFRANLSANYQKVIIHTPDQPDIDAEVFSLKNTVVVVRTIYKGWSVALIVNSGHNPSRNLNSYGEAGVGVEWNLIPFRTTEDKTLAVRYVIGPRYERYYAKNVMDKDDLVWGQQMAQVYFAWHFEKVDFNVTVTGYNPLNIPEYSSVGADVGVVWRITDALNVKASAGAWYQKNYTNKPLQIDYSNPVQTYLSGGNFGEFSVYSGLEISYVFGNSLLKGQDQRWNIFE